MTNPLWNVAAITSLVAALIGVLVAFGVPITEDQTNKLLTLIATGAPFVVAYFASRKVTPLNNPTDTDNTPLVRSDTLQPTRSAVKEAAKRGE